MDAITSYSYCSSKFCSDKRRGALSRGGSRVAAVPAKELLFSKTRKTFNFRILRLAAEKPGPLCPVAASLSSNSGAGPEAGEKGTEEAHLSKTVHVRFQLKKECQFGEQFLLVGNDPILGSWDPSSAIPMNWSDGNLWTLDLNIQVGRQIRFKFVLMGSAGIIQWQPDPDRVLETWETDKTITVCEDWEDAALQRIAEELQSDSSGEPTEMSEETHMVADNLSIPMEKAIHESENGSALSNRGATPAEVSLEELPNESSVADLKPSLQNRSMSIVAENITQTGDEIPTDTIDSNQAKETVLSEGDLVTFSEGPVLVPGLMPLSAVPEIEATQLKSETTTAADNVTGLEATDPDAPEAEGKQGTVMELFHQEKQLNEKQNSVPPQSTRGQDRRAEEEEGKVDLELADNVLRNDFQWGRKTLQIFLANLGLSQ
ncbi:hypothetical protein SAY87_009187 [Trapa incisa]|uniref:CBM20 domain-containing protein n=1 Tax=Trapa incisa TaxID=236973 RepID=A0AAN7JUN4_9MYRT|nr:hypothetical protein SAY87_009187 [Trapa incisa]